MRKYALFLLLFLALPFVSADIGDDLLHYYNFSVTATAYDAVGSDDGTPSGIASATGILGNAYLYSGTYTDRVSFGTSHWDLTNNNTINWWYQQTGAVSPRACFFSKWQSGNRFIVYYDGTNLQGYYPDSSDFSINKVPGFVIGAWNMITITHVNNNVTLYINGTYKMSTTTTGSVPTDATPNLYIGSEAAGSFCGDALEGVIDEWGVWNRSLSQAEIDELFNSGSACSPITNPTGCGAPPSLPYGSVTVKDLYDNATLSGLTVYMGNSSNTTDGSGVATIMNPGSYNYTVDGGVNYFNVSGTGTENATVTAYVYGAFVTLEAYNILGQQLTSFNVSSGGWSNQTSDGDTTIYLKPNTTNTVNFSAADYITLPVNFSIGSRDTGTYNTSGMYGTIYHFNASDAYFGGGLTGFTINAVNDTLGGVLYTQNDTAGWVNLSLVRGYDYFFNFTKANYEYVNVTLEANASSQFYEFSSLPAPSIDITFRDAGNNSIIYDNMTITITDNSTSTTNYSASGGFFTGAIAPGNWTVIVQSGNYSQSQYQVTVTTGAVYFLTAYLQYAPETVVMQFLDGSSLAALPGVTVTQERVVNGTWQVLSSKTTDITGRTSFRYAEDIAYRFTATATGYDQKQFTLDPILFSTYSVKLDRSQALDFAQDYAYIYMAYSPKIFYESRQNNLTIDFISPTGLFSSYNYSIAYPGGTKTGGGVNTAGESFSVPFNISGADFDDRVYINLSYDTSIGSPRSFRYDHGIIVTPGNNTFIKNQDNTYQLGLVERALIGTGVVIVVAGIAAMVAGSTVALLISLFIMGAFTYIGFWEWWLAGISFLVGLAVLAARSD